MVGQSCTKEDRESRVLSKTNKEPVEALFKEIMETQKGGHVELKALSSPMITQ